MVSMGTNGSKGANATCSWTPWGWWWPVGSKPPMCRTDAWGVRLLAGLQSGFPSHPDGDGRCRLREPQVGARAKTASRVATAHHQTPAARLQGGGPDLDSWSARLRGWPEIVA